MSRQAAAVLAWTVLVAGTVGTGAGGNLALSTPGLLQGTGLLA